MTHICVGKLTIIGSDNGLSPERRQAIIWTNAGILLIGPLGTNFSEILIVIETFSFKKMHLKTSSAKWLPFRLGLNVLMHEWLEYIWQSGTKWSELRPTWGANLVVCTFSDIYIKVLHQGTQIYFNGQPIHWIHEDEFQWKPSPNCWSFVQCSHWYGLVMPLYDVTMIRNIGSHLVWALLFSIP